jgi:phosphoserine aminotransferase
MAERVYNFSAGPAALPAPVLAVAQRDLMAFPGVGASILEISHRSGTFRKIIEKCEADLRSLLAVPDDYHVLFLQGGARLQFSMVPMNLLGTHGTADYILTGSWSKKAIEQAELEGTTRVAWDGASSKYTGLPADVDLDLNPDAAYVYFTSNETIEGVQFPTEPNTGDVPLVCDASSDLLHRPLPIEKYGLIFACAQKNLGPAGVTAVIVRGSLLERCPDKLAGMLDYRNHATQHSLYNTAPTFAIYVMGLVMRWMLDEIGGLEAMYARNREKAAMLYDVLDASDGFYTGHAQSDCRSVMSVTFRMPDESLTEKFVAEADQQGLHALKGHRSVGGLRASIYNAMPAEGVEKLSDFMVAFQKQHQG